MERTTAEQLQALTLEVEELRAAREEDRVLLEQLQVSTIVNSVGGPPTKPDSPTYPGWTTWVDEWLTARISRRQQRIRWCQNYAEHPEVADRLEALWHAWEVQWPEPELRLSWFRDGFDHQFAVMTAEDGPLRECSAFENVHSLPPTIGG